MDHKKQIEVRVKDHEKQIENLECTLVSPTKNLLLLKGRGETTQASSLVMLMKRCSADRAHFVQSPPPLKVTTDIKHCLMADLQHLESTGEHDGRIFAAMSEIIVNKKRLKSLGSNEADIRYAMCNPIMSMVCDCYNYTLKLEESIKENLGWKTKKRQTKLC